MIWACYGIPDNPVLKPIFFCVYDEQAAQEWLDDSLESLPTYRTGCYVLPDRDRLPKSNPDMDRMLYPLAEQFTSVLYPTQWPGKPLGELGVLQRRFRLWYARKNRVQLPKRIKKVAKPVSRADVLDVGMLVDGHNLMIRAKFAGKLAELSTFDGRPSGMLFGTITNFLSIYRQVRPSHLAWLFDYGRSTYRLSIYPEYKANRPKNRERDEDDQDSFQMQFEALLEFLDLMGIKNYREKGVEADDHIAALCHSWKGNKLLVSSDHDLQQLVNSETMIFLPSKPQHTHMDSVLDRDSIIAKHGLPPERLAELWSLVGDRGDNIFGVNGIGPKRGLALLKDAPLDQVLQEDPKLAIDGSQQRVIDNFFLIDLVTGRQQSSVDLRREDCAIDESAINKDGLAEFFDKWEFDSLARQLNEDALW